MLMGLPDSMDMVSLWDNSSNLSQGKIEDLRMVQQKKGTKVLMCTFIQYVGKGFTPAEYDVDEATREAFWGWVDDDEAAIKTSMEKYAQAIADTITSTTTTVWISISNRMSMELWANSMKTILM